MSSDWFSAPFLSTLSLHREGRPFQPLVCVKGKDVLFLVFFRPRKGPDTLQPGEAAAAAPLSSLLQMAAVWIPVLSLLQLAHCTVTYRHTAGGPVWLDQQSATSFLSRSLLYNSWDLELVVPDDMERECVEETCTYEEAREIFEDDTQTEIFWTQYVNSQVYAPRVDVSGLVAGIMAVLVSAVIATVLGIYFYKAKNKSGSRPPVRMVQDGRPGVEMVPLAPIAAPGLPSYNEALHRSGQHDAPPPPYSGGAPSEAADPGEAAE